MEETRQRENTAQFPRDQGHLFPGCVGPGCPGHRGGSRDAERYRELGTSEGEDQRSEVEFLLRVTRGFPLVMSEMLLTFLSHFCTQLFIFTITEFYLLVSFCPFNPTCSFFVDVVL